MGLPIIRISLDSGFNNTSEFYVFLSAQYMVTRVNDHKSLWGRIKGITRLYNFCVYSGSFIIGTLSLLMNLRFGLGLETEQGIVTFSLKWLTPVFCSFLISSDYICSSILFACPSISFCKYQVILAISTDLSVSGHLAAISNFLS